MRVLVHIPNLSTDDRNDALQAAGTGTASLVLAGMVREGDEARGGVMLEVDANQLRIDSPTNRTTVGIAQPRRQGLRRDALSPTATHAPPQARPEELDCLLGRIHVLLSRHSSEEVNQALRRYAEGTAARAAIESDPYAALAAISQATGD